MNPYLDDEEAQARDALNSTGLNGEEVASAYLNSLPKPPEEDRATKLNKALGLPTIPFVDTSGKDSVTAPAEGDPTYGDYMDKLAKAPEGPNPTAQPLQPPSKDDILKKALGILPNPSKAGVEGFIQAMYAAGTRGKLPDSFFQREQQKELADDKLAAALRHQKEKEGADYTSPTARALQDQYKRDNPDLDPAKIDFYTPDQIIKLQRRGLNKEKLAETVREHGVSEGQKDTQIKETARKNVVAEDLKRYGLDQAGAEHVAGRLEKYNTDTKDLQMEDATLKETYNRLPPLVSTYLLNTPVEKTNIQVRDFLDHPNMIEDRIAARVPLIGSSLRNLLSSDDPKDIAAREGIKSAWATFRNTKTNKLFGANFSPSEQVKAEAMFNDKIFDKPEYMLAAMEMFRSIQAQEIANKEAHLRLDIPSNVYNHLSEQGVLTSNDPFYAGLHKAKGPALADSNQSIVQKDMSGAAAQAVPSIEQGSTAPQAPPPISTSTKVKEPLHVPVSYKYSPSRNKTKVTYSDGTEEVFDGAVP